MTSFSDKKKDVCHLFREKFIPNMLDIIAFLFLLHPLLNAFSLGITLQSPFRAQTPLHPATIPATCNCTGTNNTGPAGKPYICRDPRLGPRLLPKKFPLLSFVSDYDRFGGQRPGQFLDRWTDPKTGWYVYPPKNGFCLDQSGEPIVGNMTLEVGTKVDRFGSEYGALFCLTLPSPSPSHKKCEIVHSLLLCMFFGAKLRVVAVVVKQAPTSPQPMRPTISAPSRHLISIPRPVAITLTIITCTQLLSH